MSRRTTALAAAVALLALGPSLITGCSYTTENIALRRANQAITDYTQAIAINPNDANAYYMRGISRRDLKDYQGAISDYSKAIEIYPEDAFAYRNRGIAKELVGDLKGACADWKKASSLGVQEAASWVEDQCQ